MPIYATYQQHAFNATPQFTIETVPLGARGIMLNMFLLCVFMRIDNITIVRGSGGGARFERICVRVDPDIAVKVSTLEEHSRRFHMSLLHPHMRAAVVRTELKPLLSGLAIHKSRDHQHIENGRDIIVACVGAEIDANSEITCRWHLIRVL